MLRRAASPSGGFALRLQRLGGQARWCHDAYAEGLRNFKHRKADYEWLRQNLVRWMRTRSHPNPMRMFDDLTYRADSGRGLTLTDRQVATVIHQVAKCTEKVELIVQFPTRSSHEDRAREMYHHAYDMVIYAIGRHNVGPATFEGLLRCANNVHTPNVKLAVSIIETMRTDSTFPNPEAVHFAVLLDGIWRLPKTADRLQKWRQAETMMRRSAIPYTFEVLDGIHRVHAAEGGFRMLEEAVDRSLTEHPAVFNKRTINSQYIAFVAHALSNIEDKRLWLKKMEDLGLKLAPRNYTLYMTCARTVQEVKQLASFALRKCERDTATCIRLATTAIISLSRQEQYQAAVDVYKSLPAACLSSTNIGMITLGCLTNLAKKTKSPTSSQLSEWLTVMDRIMSESQVTKALEVAAHETKHAIYAPKAADVASLGDPLSFDALDGPLEPPAPA
ncbi:hypothetical protein DIPPA_16477 [Diplonema papillatum]|nr:hypothetical protein DIPPA_16477 [Diplonema papillatum]